MPALLGVFFDAGNTLVVEEPGKHLWEMAITPLPGALEVLAALKSRYRLGVISNTVGSGDAELAAALGKAGLRSLIDAMVTSRDFGRAKPDPAIYVEGARRLGVPLETTRADPHHYPTRRVTRVAGDRERAARLVLVTRSFSATKGLASRRRYTQEAR